MQVIAYDPFLSPERAQDLGVEKVELDELLERADFITLHTPLTDADQEHHRRGGARQDEEGRAHHQLRPRRPGRRAGAASMRSNSGHVAGAAFDVFVEEPATENPLFGHPNVICTPHLGASTTEAQENVALQVAEQMSDYLMTRRHLERRQLPVDHGGGGAEAEAVHRARREARLVRRPAHRDRHHEGRRSPMRARSPR